MARLTVLVVVVLLIGCTMAFGVPNRRCPPHAPMVECRVDQCEYIDCGSFAKCESSNCGGCFAKCVDIKG